MVASELFSHIKFSRQVLNNCHKTLYPRLKKKNLLRFLLAVVSRVSHYSINTILPIIKARLKNSAKGYLKV